MAILTRGKILGADDKRRELVEVPDWGGELYIRSLSAAELDEYESSINDGRVRNLDNLRARLVVRCAVDEAGTQIFDDKDADLLGEKNAAAVDTCYEVAARLNRRSQADMEALAKNSKAAQRGSSPTATQPPPESESEST